MSNTEINNLKMKAETMKDLYLEGQIPDAVYRKAQTKIEKQIAELSGTAKIVSVPLTDLENVAETKLRAPNI